MGRSLGRRSFVLTSLARGMFPERTASADCQHSTDGSGPRPDGRRCRIGNCPSHSVIFHGGPLLPESCRDCAGIAAAAGRPQDVPAVEDRTPSLINWMIDARCGGPDPPPTRLVEAVWPLLLATLSVAGAEGLRDTGPRRHTDRRRRGGAVGELMDIETLWGWIRRDRRPWQGPRSRTQMSLRICRRRTGPRLRGNILADRETPSDLTAYVGPAEVRL
jgi:hypothetical protein